MEPPGLAGRRRDLVALQEIPVEELAAAASRDDVSRMKTILESNPQAVSQYSRDGWTALHVACYFGMAEAVRFLLDRQASPHVVSRNSEARTPVHLAAGGIANQVEILRSLIEAGADLTMKDARGDTPLEIARRRGNTALVALLGGRP